MHFGSAISKSIATREENDFIIKYLLVSAIARLFCLATHLIQYPIFIYKNILIFWTTRLLIFSIFLFFSSILSTYHCSSFFVPVTRSVLTQDPQFCVPQNCYVSFVPVAHSVLTQDPQFWNAKLLCFLRSCSTFCTNAGPSVLKRKTVMFPSVL